VVLSDSILKELKRYKGIAQSLWATYLGRQMIPFTKQRKKRRIGYASMLITENNIITRFKEND